MEARDLRIGNIVQGGKFSIPRKQIFSDGIMKITAYGISMFEQGKIKFEPIPLTEEYLLKFGFVKSKTHDKYYTKNANLAISTADNKFVFLMGNFVCQLILIELKYVHSLQNLIFALTGEELQIN